MIIVYDPYGELKKVADEILEMNEAKKPDIGGKHGKR